MLFIITPLITLLTLLSTALSQPLEARAPSHYKLQTRIVPRPHHNDTGTFKGRLWVEAYHTGAALNDAVLTTNRTSATIGSLNSTVQEFEYGTYTYYFVMGGDANYAAWEPVEINAFDGSSGFVVNATGLQWNATYGFGGWLACDWFHGMPQLFWLNAFYNYTLPTSCSEVNLIVVPV